MHVVVLIGKISNLEFLDQPSDSLFIGKYDRDYHHGLRVEWDAFG